MMLWAAFAALTAVAVIALLVPLTRNPKRIASAEASASSIYARQLREIDRDLARGLIGPNEAEAARAEVGRRLLRAADADGRADDAGPRPARSLATVLVIAVPLAAVGFYLYSGAPGLPDDPLSERRAEGVSSQSIDDLVARVEQRLRDNPGDGRGWEVIAPVYLRLGRAGDAVAAYQNAIRLNGDSAALETGLGAALAMLADGVVTRDARLAFERAANLDPNAVQPRFYLAIALGQEGRTAEARAVWQALIGGAKGDEPWLAAAREELAALDGGKGGAPAAGDGAMPPAGSGPGPVAPAAPGPSAADVDAAAAMSPQERAKMIEGMVAGLADRLAKDGGSAAEWLRLVRAYRMLDRTDDAKAALAEARKALAGDAAGLAEVNTGAAALGID